ncbi:PP2C family protein-serine/threonine phosphatase, partial [candidate division KSB1 bacterium]|nr:PP2C family protein-serine/threonine phosphatase [candidate division KSB1 bacterium]
GLLQQTFQVDEYHFQYFITYLNIFIEIFFLGLGSFLIWSNGESMTREIWPPKLRSVDALFSGRFFSIEQGKGIFRGFAMAGIQLGLSSLITYCLLHFSNAWFLPADEEKILFSSIFPPLVPFTYGLLSVFMGVAWPLLFTWSFLKRILKKTLLAGFISLILFEICFSEYAIYNIWLRIAVIILIALVTYYFYLRYDVFTVAVGIFIIVVIEYSIRFLIQPNTLFTWVGGISLTIPLILLIYGTVLVIRGNELDDAEITPRYVRFVSERERLKLELDIARKAQLKMLPQRVPNNPSLDIAACSEPAREVGGDYYDFITLDSNRLGIVIGDVSGKGMPAALYMTLTKGFFLQAVSESHKSPKEMMTKINRNFYNTAESRIFITLFYGIIDLTERKMTYLRAGHTPIVFRKSIQEQARLLQPTGIAIGLEQGPLFEKTLQVETIPINAGNFFVFYTDGLTEGMNPAKEEFGEDRLLSIVQNAPSRSAQELLEHIRKEHKKFIGRQEALDDFTCVVVKIL